MTVMPSLDKLLDWLMSIWMNCRQLCHNGKTDNYFAKWSVWSLHLFCFRLWPRAKLWTHFSYSWVVICKSITLANLLYEYWEQWLHEIPSVTYFLKVYCQVLSNIYSFFLSRPTFSVLYFVLSHPFLKGSVNNRELSVEWGLNAACYGSMC